MKKYEGTKDYTVRAFPDMSGKKAMILPGAFSGAVTAMMAESGFEAANSVDEADVVVFVGGADIDPSLYGQKNVASGGINKARDNYEKTVYDLCIKEDKVMFGICRGAQFLHAMNGGKLWQDVNNHTGKDHWIVDIEEDVRVMATSIHHQMLQDNENLQVIAVTEEIIATRFQDEDFKVDYNRAGVPPHSVMEVEAGCYPDTKCFFVQGHPEVGSRYYQSWTLNKLNDFMVEAENGSPVQSREEIVRETLRQIG